MCSPISHFIQKDTSCYQTTPHQYRRQSFLNRKLKSLLVELLGVSGRSVSLRSWERILWIVASRCWIDGRGCGCDCRSSWINGAQCGPSGRLRRALNGNEISSTHGNLCRVVEWPGWSIVGSCETEQCMYMIKTK